MDLADLLPVALEEARTGASEGGVPIGAALYASDGRLLGRGRNRRVQDGDPSAHAETDAFRRAGRQADYRDTIIVTTLAPCWYCCGLIRQFAIPTVVFGESRTFAGGTAWLAELGVSLHDLDDEACVALMERFVTDHPDIWFEDIGGVAGGR